MIQKASKTIGIVATENYGADTSFHEIIIKHIKKPHTSQSYARSNLLKTHAP